MFSAASDWLVMEFYWICNCCFVSFYNILIIWDFFFNQRHRGLGRKSLNTINRSQSYDLLITIHDALQLSYRRLLGAKATKGHFNTSSPRHKINIWRWILPNFPVIPWNYFNCPFLALGVNIDFTCLFLWHFERCKLDNTTVDMEDLTMRTGVLTNLHFAHGTLTEKLLIQTNLMLT